MRRGTQGVDTNNQLQKADGHLVDMVGRPRLEVPKSFDTHHGDGEVGCFATWFNMVKKVGGLVGWRCGVVVGSLCFFFWGGGIIFFLNTGLMNGANQKNRFVFYLMIGAWALHWEFSFLVSYIFFTSNGGAKFGAFTCCLKSIASFFLCLMISYVNVLPCH